jgi:hypothetical protein
LCAPLPIARAQRRRFGCVPEYFRCTGKPFFGASLDIAISQGRRLFRASLDFVRTQGRFSGCVPGYCLCRGTPFLGASLAIARAGVRRFLGVFLDIGVQRDAIFWMCSGIICLHSVDVSSVLT